MNKDTRTIVTGVVVTILVIFVGAWAFNQRGTDTKTDTGTSTQETTEQEQVSSTTTNSNDVVNKTITATTNTKVTSDIGITIPAQKAGNKVTLDAISVAKPTWIAIADNVNGKPGRILGARLFDNTKTVGEVELLRNTVSGTKYLVLFYADTVLDAKFDTKKDTFINPDGGALVEFTAQ